MGLENIFALWLPNQHRPTSLVTVNTRDVAFMIRSNKHKTDRETKKAGKGVGDRWVGETNKQGMCEKKIQGKGVIVMGAGKVDDESKQ